MARENVFGAVIDFYRNAVGEALDAIMVGAAAR
jgi:hypothetical protein